MKPVAPRLFLQGSCAAVLLLAGLPPAAAADDAPAKAHMATCAKPEWPKEALRKEQTGKVTLSFKVGADGTVLESVVKQSSGFPLLDEAARTALISCKFKPAMVDGRAAASWVAIQYVWTLEDKIDPAAVPAFDAMRERAALGDIVAQRELGTLYAQGKGVARSAEQAARWMTRAAQAGDAVAQFRMGAAYQGGVGVPADAAQAMAWYRKAAEQGYPHAQMVLGTLYQRGQGVPHDEVQAVAWFRLAVAQNFGPAFTSLAGMTRQGRGGIVADAAEARRLLRQGAALNDLYAQYHLGAELLSNGTAQEQADGVRWLLKAAPLALPPLQALLGFAYRDGVGIGRDYVQARAWLHKAAAQSWPAAQYALAVLTEQGLGGPRNDTEALALYQKAAREMPNAALRLADASAQGELGMGIDPARADEWRQKAAGMVDKPR